VSTADHWTSAIFALAATVTFSVALHPFLTYPISLAILPRRRAVVPPHPTFDRPPVAVCMAAFNEEKVIVAKVESLLAMAHEYGPATIHIYVDGSTDATAALLAPYADRVDLVVSNDRRGKTAGLNMLITRSDSPLMAFTDANVIAPPAALIGLSAPFGDPTVGCTSARLEYSNSGDSPTSQAGTVYWRIEEMLKRIESDTVGVIGVDGALFMIRRSVYEPAPDRLIDDLYVSLIVMIRGFQTRTVEQVVVYERSATRWIEEFRRKRRIACQALNVHRALWPRLRRLKSAQLYAYLSHRFLKWCLPFLLGLSGIFALAAFYMAFGIIDTAMFTLVCTAALVCGSLAGLKPCMFALSALASLAGVAAGVIQSLVSRQTYTVWTPAASVRD
jgi:cellulose synthase/poly-beta-1,6-N-acetylglucosamine synthase-like glycosyltransferase